MVKILHKYILKDLLRTFILATVGLTVIFSLGSILQPLQEHGVSPRQAFVIISYFSPVILTFVMPVAALFSTAITYGRFAADNEFDACRASGVSAFKLMSSAFLLAIFIAVVNLILNFSVVPYFIGRTEENVTSNVRTIVLRSIQKHGFYNMRDRSRQTETFILADVVNVADDRLFGVNMLQTREGRPRSLVSVAQADVSFETDGTYNYISAVAYDVFQADNSGIVYSQRLPIGGRFASLMLDRIRFKTFDELRAINEDVLQFQPVKEQAQRVMVRLRTELLAKHIRAKQYEQTNPYYTLNTDDKIYLLSAEQIDAASADGVISLSGIKMYEYNAEKPETVVNVWKANTGSLEIDESINAQKWALILNNAVWTDAQGVSGLPMNLSVRDIHTPESVSKALSGDMLETIDHLYPAFRSERLDQLKERLDYMLADTGAAMAIEVNSRLVFGIGCIFLILCGAALGIIYKGGHVLTSFGISVVPVAILVVFIMMGKNLTKNMVRSGTGGAEFGIMIMWCGLVVLALLLLGIYRKLLKT